MLKFLHMSRSPCKDSHCVTALLWQQKIHGRKAKKSGLIKTVTRWIRYGTWYGTANTIISEDQISFQKNTARWITVNLRCNFATPGWEDSCMQDLTIWDVAKVLNGLPCQVTQRYVLASADQMIFVCCISTRAWRSRSTERDEDRRYVARWKRRRYECSYQCTKCLSNILKLLFSKLRLRSTFSNISAETVRPRYGQTRYTKHHIVQTCTVQNQVTWYNTN